jgi:hypothetical protein
MGMNLTDMRVLPEVAFIRLGEHVSGDAWRPLAEINDQTTGTSA